MPALGAVTSRSANTAAPAGPVEGATAAKDVEVAPIAFQDEPASQEAGRVSGTAGALADAARGHGAGVAEQVMVPRVGELAAAPAGEQEEGPVGEADSGPQAVSSIGEPPAAAERADAERGQTVGEAGIGRLESLPSSRRRNSGRSRRRASARAGSTARVGGGGVLAALRRLPPGPAAELLVAWSLYLALQVRCRSWRWLPWKLSGLRMGDGTSSLRVMVLHGTACAFDGFLMICIACNAPCSGSLHRPCTTSTPV